MALAANFVELFDFETHFEAAAQTILDTAGVNAFISRQTDKLPLINTGVVFSVGPAIDELTFLPLDSGQSLPPSQEYFRYVGSLELRLEIERDTQKPPNSAGVSSFFAEARSLIRKAFRRSQWPFDDTNLEFYRVSNIRPNGGTEGFDQSRNVDSLILRFEITFAIMQDAWPTNP